MSANLFGEDEEEGMPVISLWRPWATWVMLGWKTIETRTHDRFRSLAGKRVGIHAADRWDINAEESARPYLSREQFLRTLHFVKTGSKLLGTVYVPKYRPLTKADAWQALIECESVQRYGLFLEDPQSLKTPIPMKGKQGIWYIPSASIEGKRP